MKIAAILSLLVAGCAVVPPPLESFPGWSTRKDGVDRFQIYVGVVKEDRWHEALLFAAAFTLRQNYRAFAIVEEDGKGDSGTMFFWAQGFDGRAAMKSFSPGRYFTIICRQELPTEYETWFDALKTLKRERPNKAPEPTPGAVTPRATEGVSR